MINVTKIRNNQSEIDDHMKSQFKANLVIVRMIRRINSQKCSIQERAEKRHKHLEQYRQIYRVDTNMEIEEPLIFENDYVAYGADIVQSITPTSEFVPIESVVFPVPEIKKKRIVAIDVLSVLNNSITSSDDKIKIGTNTTNTKNSFYDAVNDKLVRLIDEVNNVVELDQIVLFVKTVHPQEGRSQGTDLMNLTIFLQDHYSIGVETFVAAYDRNANNVANKQRDDRLLLVYLDENKDRYDIVCVSNDKYIDGPQYFDCQICYYKLAISDDGTIIETNDYFESNVHGNNLKYAECNIDVEQCHSETQCTFNKKCDTCREIIKILFSNIYHIEFKRKTGYDLIETIY